jgi:dienelactone hydrolase
MSYMADIVLFHHAQGLTSGVLDFADRFRSEGHTVHTPDLFAGKTFPTVDEGIEYAREIGFGNVLERGVQAGRELGTGLVYAGMSLGAMPAQKLAQTQPNSAGAVLLHSAIPISEFSDTWPIGVPVQIHAMENDEFYLEDAAAAAELVETAGAELFLYPGDAHLFTDNSLAAYSESATELVVERVLAFLLSLSTM